MSEVAIRVNFETRRQLEDARLEARELRSRNAVLVSCLAHIGCTESLHKFTRDRIGAVLREYGLEGFRPVEGTSGRKAREVMA